jgi:2-oxoglutarate dehydrogenase E2 component (dihydrolipoamide succinyltransferase)
MTIEVKVPQLPESVADATLVAWHKKAGESVQRDDNLVDLETDKVVLEVPAPRSGTLTEIRITDGATVTSGQVLALLEPGEGTVTASTPEPAVGAAAPAPSSPETQPAAPGKSAHKLGPAVRRMVEEHDLDAEAIAGSGKDGRITKSDVMAYMDQRRGDSAGIEFDQATPVTGSTAPGVPTRTAERVPMTRLRARIAERMVEAQRTAAMLTTFNEVDLSEVMALRARYKETFIDQHDVKLGFMSFFVKAAVSGLKRFPVVNASVESNDVIYHDYFDIGIAVSSDRGLLVPVLRDADALSFAEIEAAINDFGGRARSGGITMDDLTGGTFTITNGGVFGSMMSTPILNPPQSAILGMHTIQQRPMVVNGEVVARPMMYLALTYDHRIVDGREAVQFLVNVKQQLEDPARLMLQV